MSSSKSVEEGAEGEEEGVAFGVDTSRSTRRSELWGEAGGRDPLEAADAGCVGSLGPVRDEVDSWGTSGDGLFALSDMAFEGLLVVEDRGDCTTSLEGELWPSLEASGAAFWVESGSDG